MRRACAAFTDSARVPTSFGTLIDRSSLDLILPFRWQRQINQKHSESTNVRRDVCFISTLVSGEYYWSIMMSDWVH